MTTPHTPYRQNTDTKLEIFYTESHLKVLEEKETVKKSEFEEAKLHLEAVQLELEKIRTKLQELQRCLAISDRFTLDSHDLPCPLLPGEEPVIPEGRAIPRKD